jgi:hypothetical protein
MNLSQESLLKKQVRFVFTKKNSFVKKKSAKICKVQAVADTPLKPIQPFDLHEAMGKRTGMLRDDLDMFQGTLPEMIVNSMNS